MIDLPSTKKSTFAIILWEETQVVCRGYYQLNWNVTTGSPGKVSVRRTIIIYNLHCNSLKTAIHQLIYFSTNENLSDNFENMK